MIDLEEVKEKLPEAWHPVIDQYGPALVAMTIKELCAWVGLHLAGHTRAAWDAVAAKLEGKA